MNTDRTGIPTILCAALLVLASVGSARIQAQNRDLRKFDEFENLMPADIQARLDRFSKELGRDEQLQGFIVGYRSEGWRAGSFLREVHGFREYMVNSLGVHPDRIKVIDAGLDRIKTELWLGAVGSNFPTPAKLLLPLGNVNKFDQLTMGPGCESEYTLVPQQPRDAVRFFGEELGRNPAAKGHVVVHPSGALNPGQAAKLAAIARDSLIREYGIAADRISTSVELPRACASRNLWLAPANLPLPTGNRFELFFYSELMGEAERNNYTVRRIELLGNTYTRDNVIRRRLLQNEGDIFQRALLEQSLRSVSKLRYISPVGMQDVEVHLNRDEATIDFLINLTDRSKPRKPRTQ